MPVVHANGIDLAYTEAGSGYPLVLCHEFGGSMESWAPQVHYFSRRYRVIAYNARGYPPSTTPTDSADYSQDIAVEDLRGLLRALDIDNAHICGLSMGGSTALHFGVRYPDLARSLVVAAAGTGSTNVDEFRKSWLRLADLLEVDGMAALADYSLGPTRVQLQRKDPTGWEEFARLLEHHSPLGSALTARGVQVGRPPIFVWDKELESLQVPTLVLVGDEDEPCIEASLFLKRHIPNCGLGMLPRSGHAINLEEPALFNDLCSEFFSEVEAGKWFGRTSPAAVGG